MNTMRANTVGAVAEMSPALGAAPAVPAAVTTAAVVPPPNLAFRASKFELKPALSPTRRARNATNVPNVAMIQKAFCQRNVVFRPAIRMAVTRTIIDTPPRKTHSFFVWKLVPHSTSVELSNRTPSDTRMGPRAKTGKNRAQNVAPIIADSAAAKLLTIASGGARIRLTQT